MVSPSRAVDAMVPLFVPADRPERFAKAAASGADAVILDLEDAVAPAAKDEARSRLVAAGGLAVPTIIRINGRATPWHDADLDAVAWSGAAAILLPKVESAGEVEAVRARLGERIGVMALVETAAGLAALADVLRSSVDRLAFGSLDFAADLGCAHRRDTLAFARWEIALASRVADRLLPLDGVTETIDDAARIEDDARHAADMGFGGKLAIHPRQVEPIRVGLRPDASEVEWARAVLAATTAGGVGRLAGAMVDAPVVARARRVIARCGASGG